MIKIRCLGLFDLVRSKNSVVSYPALLLHMNLSHKQRFEGLVKEDAVKEVIFFFLFLSIETHKDHRLVFFFSFLDCQCLYG